MEQLKRFPGAAAACAVAVIAAIVAVLALTVWKPAQQISATVSPEQPVVITREGLFQLGGSEVTVTARSASGKDVTMALGTSSDVRAWVSDLSYAEITGIAANRSELLTQGHDAQPTATPSATPSPSPSSEQPQNPEGNQQPSPTPSATPTLSAAGGDMWIDEATSASSATMTLRDVAAGRSLVITSDGTTASDLTVTMTWQTPHANVLAVLAGIITLICALIAAGLVVFTLWRERQVSGEDGTESKTRGFAASGALLKKDRQGQEEPAEGDSGEEPAEGSDEDVEGEGSLAENGEVQEGGEDIGEEPADDDLLAADEQHEAHVASELENLEQMQDEPETHDEGSTESHTDAEHEPEDNAQHDAEAASHIEETEPRRGRHGIASEDHEVDPPQRESTDTGIIDLSSIRPGAVLPSRRALRQARENGEDRVVIGGQEFDTGLIPQVAKETQPSEDDSSQKRPWGAIMGAWMSPKQSGKKEK